MENLSKEQKEIIKCLEKYSVVVNAIAGSGKTTTILEICKAYPEKNFLVLTYNRKLADDAIERIKKENINNCQLNTIHSIAAKFFGVNCQNAKGLKKIIKYNLQIKNNVVYDYIIVDEAQDLTLLLFEIIIKIINHFYLINNKLKLMICGDQRQTIYEYDGASEVVLTNTKSIIKKFKWKKLALSKSFRCPENICKFVNEFIFKKEYMISNQDSGLMEYKVCNLFDVHDKISELILDDIDKFGLDKVALLSPYLSNNEGNLVNLIANEITLQKNIFFSISKKDVKKDKKFLENKFLITTVHQAKGTEKDVIYLFNFDNFYKEICFSKHDNISIKKWEQQMQNLLYVACTRARKKLIILNQENNAPIQILLKKPNSLTVNDVDFSLSTISQKNVYRYWNYNLINTNINRENKQKFKNFKSITELIDKWDDFLISEFISKNFKIFKIKKNNQVIKVNDSISGRDGGIEDLSTINGTFAGLINIFEKNDWEKQIYTLINERISIANNDIFFIENITSKKVFETISKELSCLLEDKQNNYIKKKIRYAMLLQAYKSLLVYQLKQIPIEICDWIKEDEYKKIIENFNAIFDNKKNNFFYEYTISNLINNIYVFGSIDALDEKNQDIWEFKFVNEVKNYHLIQVVMYYYLLCLKDKNYFVYKMNLYNIKKAEHFTIEFIGEDFLKAMEDFFVKINNKVKQPKIKDFKNIYKKYFSKKERRWRN